MWTSYWYKHHCITLPFFVEDYIRFYLIQQVSYTTDNEWYYIKGGEDDFDEVFLLSLEEADEHFGSGSLDLIGYDVFWSGGVGGGVRPALWLNL